MERILKSIIWALLSLGIGPAGILISGLSAEATVNKIKESFSLFIISVLGSETLQTKYPNTTTLINTAKSQGYTENDEIISFTVNYEFEPFSSLTGFITMSGLIKKVFLEFAKAHSNGDCTIKVVAEGGATSANLYEYWNMMYTDPTCDNTYSQLSPQSIERIAIVKYIADNYKLTMVRPYAKASYLNTKNGLNTKSGYIFNLETFCTAFYPTTGNSITKYYDSTQKKVLDTPNSNTVEISMYEWDSTVNIANVIMSNDNPDDSDYTLRAVDSTGTVLKIATFTDSAFTIRTMSTGKITQDVSVNPLTDNYYLKSSYANFGNGSEYSGMDIKTVASNFSKDGLCGTIYDDAESARTFFNTGFTQGDILLEAIMINGSTDPAELTMAVKTEFATAYSDSTVDIVTTDNYIIPKQISGSDEDVINDTITFKVPDDTIINDVMNGGDTTNAMVNNGIYPVDTGSKTIITSTGTTVIPADTPVTNIIPVTATPKVSDIVFSNNGMVSLYIATQHDITLLSAKLWSTDFFDNIIKIFANPMDAIISVGYVPIIPDAGILGNVHLGNYNTGLPMWSIINQYQEIDCGMMSFTGEHDNFLDYTPYTKIQIYLPFIGMVNINANDVMNKTIKLKYDVDLTTGCCVASIYRTDDLGLIETLYTNKPLYTFTGNCMRQIPVTGANYAQLYTSLMKTTADIGLTAVTGGATAGSLIGDAANIATTIAPDIQRGGSLSANTGFLGELYPYAIVTSPIDLTPEASNHYIGVINNKVDSISNVNGFIQVRNVIMDNPYFTDMVESEKNEILNLLADGIYV